MLNGKDLHPGGPSFEATNFSEDAKRRLEQHYERMTGTLRFWKKRATIFARMHYYSIGWTIPASVAIPFLAQAVDGTDSAQWLLTLVSGHVALILAFHRGLKVDQNFQAFRQGESDFYDLYRRLLDRPHAFGDNEPEQLDQYFRDVEVLRRQVRNAETENLPSAASPSEGTSAP
jgi:hypothetical protein